MKARGSKWFSVHLSRLGALSLSDGVTVDRGRCGQTGARIECGPEWPAAERHACGRCRRLVGARLECPTVTVACRRCPVTIDDQTDHCTDLRELYVEPVTRLTLHWPTDHLLRKNVGIVACRNVASDMLQADKVTACSLSRLLTTKAFWTCRPANYCCIPLRVSHPQPVPADHSWCF